MSTGSFENWAGNIADIGVIYPFAGNEGFFVILGVAFWLGWHIINIIAEGNEWEEDLEKFGGKPLPGDEYTDL